MLKWRLLIHCRLVIDELDADNIINATEVIVIDFNIRADLKLSLNNDEKKILGSIKIKQILWTLSRAEIEGGEAFQLDLQALVDITTPLLEELANKRLGRGVPIPMIDGVNLENLRFTILNRTAELCADLKYTGDFDLSEVLDLNWFIEN